MKDRITPDQLNELSVKQQDILRDLWTPEKGQCVSVQVFTFINSVGTYSGDYTCTGVSIMVPNSMIPYTTMRLISPGVPVRTYLKAACLPLLSIGQMARILSGSGVQTFGNIKDFCDDLWDRMKIFLLNKSEV